MKSFDEFLNEDESYTGSVRIHSVTFFCYPTQVTVLYDHPNICNIDWFKLDKDSVFQTGDTRATELFIVETLGDWFNDKKNLSKKEELFKSSIFKKWWEESLEKYKTKLISKKFGI